MSSLVPRAIETLTIGLGFLESIAQQHESMLGYDTIYLKWQVSPKSVRFVTRYTIEVSNNVKLLEH